MKNWRSHAQDAVVLFIGVVAIIVLGSAAFYGCSFLITEGLRFIRQLK